MMSRREAVAAWLQAFRDAIKKAGSPSLSEARRAFWYSAESQRAIEQWAEAWLKAGGLVPRKRFLEVLEENEQLRRRVGELQRQLGGTADEGPTGSVDNVFEDLVSAQKRWLDMWMPPGPPNSNKD